MAKFGSRCTHLLLRALACWVCLVPWTQPAHAMTVLQVDLKQLVTTADLVLYGTIARTTVIDRRKDDRGVWTEFTLNVREAWKGEGTKIPTPFTWRHVGGSTPDGMTVAIPGMPTFAAGQEVVVILEKTAEGWVVSGGPQGKFSVIKDKSGQATVRRDIVDAWMVRRDAAGHLTQAPQMAPIARTLKEFRAEVLGYVQDAQKAAASKSAVPKAAGPLAP